MDTQALLRKHGCNEGDVVEVRTAHETYRGTVLPSFDPAVLSLKLDNGYNAGLPAGDVREMRKVAAGKRVAKHASGPAQKHDPKKPVIAVLHTGGTIASRVDYRTGAVFASFDPQDLFALYPELLEKANVTSVHLSNMWSDDTRFAHYAFMAREIEKQVKAGVRGVILGSGTDNLHLTASALSFMLENCPVPVLVVGAQRSSDRGSSDAAMNLDCAAEFILQTDFAGVAICMHAKSGDTACAILPATKTRKMHTSRRDAFRPVNDTEIARVDYASKKITFVKKEYPRRGDAKKLSVRDKMAEPVGLLKIHPHMYPEQFAFFRKQKYRGLVIEGTGLGHTPGHASDARNQEHAALWKELEALAKSGCVLVMTSQCLYGRVHMHVYDKGMDLQGIGVISGEDMLPEVAFVKLAWLLGQYPEKEARAMVGQNLRGEITARTEYAEDFAPF